MKKYILLFLLFLVPVAANCQEEELNLPPRIFYKNAKITLRDFMRYEVNSLHITTDSVSFVNKANQMPGSLMMVNIEYMRVQEGNQMLTWAGYGALLFALWGLYDVAAYGYPAERIFYWTITGTVIGGLVGLAIPKWKTYYIHTD